MKKVALSAAGIGAVVAMAVIGTGVASADPPNVTGEPYGKAVSILKGNGYKAVFGGSVGSDLPQSQCLVLDQTPLSGRSQRLRLDCKLQPGQEQPGAPGTIRLVPPGGSVPTEGAQRPTPGAGTVTVVPVPVG